MKIFVGNFKIPLQVLLDSLIQHSINGGLDESSILLNVTNINSVEKLLIERNI